MSRHWNSQEGSVVYLCRNCGMRYLMWSNDVDAQAGWRYLQCDNCGGVKPHDRTEVL